MLRAPLLLLAAASLAAQPGAVARYSLPLTQAPSVVDPSGNVYQASAATTAQLTTPGAAQTQTG